MLVVAVRRLLAVLALAVAVAALFAAPGGAQTASTKCTAFAVLKPGNEVPPTDSQATGAALVHINGTRLTFTVAIANPARETFILGHIHAGAAGVNGPIVVPLFDGSSDRRLFTQFDSIQISAENAAAICGNLAGHYVNYHTTDNQGGAIRGQLTRLF
jgi:trimeric autotransporter adhesin